MINFNMYHIKNSPDMRKRIIFSKFVVPFFLAFALFINFYDEFLITFIIWFLLSLTWYLLMPAFHRFIIKKRVKRLYKQEENKRILTKHRITLEEQFLLEESEFGSSQTNWNSVGKIDKDDNYIYIYLSTLSAFVIPLNSFHNNEEMEVFYSSLRSKVVSDA